MRVFGCFVFEMGRGFSACISGWPKMDNVDQDSLKISEIVLGLNIYTTMSGSLRVLLWKLAPLLDQMLAIHFPSSVSKRVSQFFLFYLQPDHVSPGVCRWPQAGGTLSRLLQSHTCLGRSHGHPPTF